MYICPLRSDLLDYLKQHQLIRKWEKAKKFFEINSRHPSLHVELLKPREYFIYSFRLDKKFRVLFVVLHDKNIEIIAITNHYK